jgi:dipeptidyl aminopeptidase/acylaminoacyl peptidase
LGADGLVPWVVTYPREGHGIAEPAHQRDLMRRNLQWFKQWVLKK